MMGVVFTEFVDFAEGRLGTLLPDANFNPVAHYEADDLLALVGRVAAETGQSVPAMLQAFGVHLFGRFVALYPVFFVEAGSAFALLAAINTEVHGEVQKLYPGARFPQFDVARPSSRRLELVYHSTLPLADLAEGLVRGCVAHFGDAVRVTRSDPAGADGRRATFTLDVEGPTSRRRPARRKPQVSRLGASPQRPSSVSDA
jgi:hypothetical protein